MNKIFYFISLIVVLTTTGFQSSQMMFNQSAHETKLDINAVVEAMHLPANTVVPEILPATIQDPVLLEGWIRLYNRTQTCELWDGTSLTGQQLAQYVVDHAVSITWNTDPAYGESSWVDRGETNNVYINPGLQKSTDMRMVNLVGTIAHEMFHGTTPFNQEEDTLYEEYWAFYVGSCVSGKAQADFSHFNPLSTANLKLWFETNNRSNYLGEFAPYPQEVLAMSIPEE